jgi:hypothetical protein
MVAAPAAPAARARAGLDEERLLSLKKKRALA